MVGQSGLEPPTSRLSVVCSSQLSYWPISLHYLFCSPVFRSPRATQHSGCEWKATSHVTPKQDRLRACGDSDMREELVEISGIAFLRKSHGGCDMPPACRPEPPFDPACAESLRCSQLCPPLSPTRTLVEISGIEPLTSCLQGRRSPS